MLEFSLPTNDILLSKIFAILDSAKATLNLQDYTISQTTLDQVFVNFASQESREALEASNAAGSRRPSDGQLPYLNDLKSRFSEIQINETRFHESANGASRTNRDELMQQKPVANLMNRSASVYQPATETGQLNQKLGRSVIGGQLPGGHLLKDPKKMTRKESKKGKKSSLADQHANFSQFGNQFTNQLTNQFTNQLTNQVALNNRLNLNVQQGGVLPSNAVFFGPPQHLTTGYSNLSGYPLNYLNSSNLYCSIGRPPPPSNPTLYNSPATISASVQQPLIVLPKARKK